MTIFLVCIVLFCTLSIDQKITFEQGEIIAKNPPSTILAPYESEVFSLRVKEGDMVVVGDTLAILKNASITSNLNISDKEVKLQEQRIRRLQQQITSLSSTIQQKEKQEVLYSNKSSLDQKNASLELKSLRQLVYTKKQAMATLKQEVSNNAILLKGGGISKQEYNGIKQRYLEATNDYNSVLQAMQEATSQEALLNNDLSTRLNELQLSILQNKNDRDGLAIQLEEEKIRWQQLRDQKNYQATEVAKSFILADQAGAIADLYNQKAVSNVLAKGEPILSIVPQQAAGFYAKAYLPQLDIKEVKQGQKANLQMNAFSFMKYGIVKGKVTFVNKNELNQFYALIEITEQNPKIPLKNGYTLKGNIIVKRVKLYAFAFKKLFAK